MRNSNVSFTTHSLGLFDLYCYTEEIYMKCAEFQFMVEKLITVTASTLSLKRAYLLEIYRSVEAKLHAGRDKLQKSDFIRLMHLLAKEAATILEEHQGRMQAFAKQLTRNRLPSFLQKDALFLGKYRIKDVVPYTTIFKNNLFAQDSVFSAPKALQQKRES